MFHLLSDERPVFLVAVDLDFAVAEAGPLPKEGGAAVDPGNRDAVHRSWRGRPRLGWDLAPQGQGRKGRVTAGRVRQLDRLHISHRKRFLSKRRKRSRRLASALE